MKKYLIIAISVFAQHVFAQKISMPVPEIRVDTVSTLNGARVVFDKPVEVGNSLVVKSYADASFLLGAWNMNNYNRFMVLKGGGLISGSNHIDTVNIDALAMIGRYNAIKGTDAFAIGKGIKNLADTTMALGYYYTVPPNKKNATIIGYGGNRIEMSADGGQFIGNWNLGGSGGFNQVNSDWNATSGIAQILNKPATIAGYGITDAVTLSGNQNITGVKTFRNLRMADSFADNVGASVVFSVSASGQLANPAIYINNPTTLRELIIQTDRLLSTTYNNHTSQGLRNDPFQLDINSFFGRGTTAGTNPDIAGKIVTLNPTTGKIDPQYYDAGSGSYTLPAASETVLGGVKVGAGLNIDNGTLSVATVSQATEWQLLPGNGPEIESEIYYRIDAVGNIAVAGSFTFSGNTSAGTFLLGTVPDFNPDQMQYTPVMRQGYSTMYFSSIGSMGDIYVFGMSGANSDGVYRISGYFVK